MIWLVERSIKHINWLVTQSTYINTQFSFECSSCILVNYLYLLKLVPKILFLMCLAPQNIPFVLFDPSLYILRHFPTKHLDMYLFQNTNISSKYMVLIFHQWLIKKLLNNYYKLNSWLIECSKFSLLIGDICFSSKWPFQWKHSAQHAPSCSFQRHCGEINCKTNKGVEVAKSLNIFVNIDEDVTKSSDC